MGCGGSKARRREQEDHLSMSEDDVQATKHDMNACHKLFDKINRRNNGTINAKELAEYFEIPEDIYVERLVKLLDTSRVGEVTFRDFLLGLGSLGSEKGDTKALFAFRLFDIDGSGSVTLSELLQAMEAGEVYEVVGAPKSDVKTPIQKMVKNLEKEGRAWEGPKSVLRLADFSDLMTKFPRVFATADIIWYSLESYTKQAKNVVDEMKRRGNSRFRTRRTLLAGVSSSSIGSDLLKSAKTFVSSKNFTAKRLGASVAHSFAAPKRLGRSVAQSFYKAKRYAPGGRRRSRDRDEGGKPPPPRHGKWTEEVRPLPVPAANHLGLGTEAQPGWIDNPNPSAPAGHGGGGHGRGGVDRGGKGRGTMPTERQGSVARGAERQGSVARAERQRSVAREDRPGSAGRAERQGSVARGAERQRSVAREGRPGSAGRQPRHHQHANNNNNNGLANPSPEWMGPNPSALPGGGGNDTPSRGPGGGHPRGGGGGGGPRMVHVSSLGKPLERVSTLDRHTTRGAGGPRGGGPGPSRLKRTGSISPRTEGRLSRRTLNVAGSLGRHGEAGGGAARKGGGGKQGGRPGSPGRGGRGEGGGGTPMYTPMAGRGIRRTGSLTPRTEASLSRKNLL